MLKVIIEIEENNDGVHIRSAATAQVVTHLESQACDILRRHIRLAAEEMAKAHRGEHVHTEKVQRPANDRHN